MVCVVEKGLGIRSINWKTQINCHSLVINLPSRFLNGNNYMNRYGVQPVHRDDLFFFGGTNVLPDFKDHHSHSHVVTHDRRKAASHLGRHLNQR